MAMWWCWPHAADGGTAGRGDDAAQGGLLAAAKTTSPLPPKKPPNLKPCHFRCVFLYWRLESPLCCYGNARVKEDDLIMSSDEISVGVGWVPSTLAAGRAGLGDRWQGVVGTSSLLH